MTLLESIQETLRSGDPLVRTWFLVENEYLPLVCCIMYVLFVKKLGPTIMRNREPFDLRKIMIVYNFLIVLTYTVSVVYLLSLIFASGAIEKICEPTIISTDNFTYWAATAAWVLYVIKYVEFADTIFFVLRKKDHLITNLHVIHHASLPVIAWIFVRTERSGFQLFPAGLNSIVHIIMYTYYGLAAMGPEVQKYLWWKEYLTKLQMVQFVVIIVFVIVIIPLSGCKTTEHGIYIEILAALLFLALFYNFYIKTYKKPLQISGKKENTIKSSYVTNGNSHSCNHEHESTEWSKKEYETVYQNHAEIKRQ